MIAAEPITYCRLRYTGSSAMYVCGVCLRKVQSPGRMEQILRVCPGPDHAVQPSLWQPSHYIRPEAPILFRDLMYHVLPDKGGHWRWSIEQLLKRWELFNGRKAFGIVTGPELDDPKAVIAMLPSDVEFYIAPNEQAKIVNGRREGPLGGRQEVVTFMPTLKKLMTNDPTRVLFRAHTKGGRWVKDDPHGAVATWTRILYRVCLDDWESVERQLLKYPCTGPFKKYNAAFDSHTHIDRPEGVTRYFPWHYSGSFYWIHTASLGGFPTWNDIEQHWFAVEPYPSQFWSARQVGCLFGDKCGAKGKELYDNDYMQKSVVPAFFKWELQQHGKRNGLSRAG